MLPQLTSKIAVKFFKTSRRCRPPRNRNLLIYKTLRPVRLIRAEVGQSLVETLLGFVIIIPIGLASVDITAMVIANHLNEHLADSAARAAANQIDSEQARKTAQDIVDAFNIAPPINDVNLETISYDLAKEQVTVITSVNVNLPVPFGTNNHVLLRANAAQPIVATPAPM
jgi:Flp pilus assembly protein TadG